MLKLWFFAIAIAIALASSLPAIAQNIVSELSGFRLGQMREVTHNELGEPDMSGKQGEELAYEAFLLKEEPELYLVFQYHKSEPEIIYSIQITGSDQTNDPGFRGLRFGASPKDVEKVLGMPSNKADAGEHGTRWEYEKGNFSVEINKLNRLSSIRISDERSDGSDPEYKLVPKFTDLVKKLQTGSNLEISEILSPGMEIYEGEKTRFFKRKFRTEVATDNSGVFSAIRRLAKELSQVDPSKAAQYEENMRMRYGRDPLHVLKFYKLKGITEIAFTWDGRRWLIWEFGAKNSEESSDTAWMNRYKAGSIKELATTRLNELIKSPNYLLSGPDKKPVASFSYNSFPTKTIVVFTGESRKTPESTMTLLGLWLTSIGRSKEDAKLFGTEFKFTEAGTDYWLPVQSTLIKHFPTEVKKGDAIMIYVAWVGIKYEKDNPESLTIVNEFTTLEKTTDP